MWEDAKRAYLKFINDEIIMRHIERKPCTLRYAYSYTLIYTKTHRINTEYIKIITNNNTINSKFNIHTEKTPTFTPVTP